MPKKLCFLPVAPLSLRSTAGPVTELLKLRWAADLLNEPWSSSRVGAAASPRPEDAGGLGGTQRCDALPRNTWCDSTPASARMRSEPPPAAVTGWVFSSVSLFSPLDSNSCWGRAHLYWCRGRSAPELWGELLSLLPGDTCFRISSNWTLNFSLFLGELSWDLAEPLVMFESGGSLCWAVLKSGRFCWFVVKGVALWSGFRCPRGPWADLSAHICHLLHSLCGLVGRHMGIEVSLCRERNSQRVNGAQCECWPKQQLYWLIFTECDFVLARAITFSLKSSVFGGAAGPDPSTNTLWLT